MPDFELQQRLSNLPSWPTSVSASVGWAMKSQPSGTTIEYTLATGCKVDGVAIDLSTAYSATMGKKKIRWTKFCLFVDFFFMNELKFCRI